MAEPGIFHRLELLFGKDVVAQIAQKRVIVFGVGGVGSWCAESLVRSGIGHLTIVDNDVVSVTNVNRQLPATTLTVGRPKVEVLRERLLEINPAADIVSMPVVYDAESSESFHLDTFDYVIDAIDSIENKSHLIRYATSLPKSVKLFSSMGAALKMDPFKVRSAEFWQVKGDPLARALRNRFKKSGLYPKRKFQCVYSEELLQNRGIDDASPDDKGWGGKSLVNGTVAHMTAIFGFALAGLVMQDLQRDLIH